MRTPVGAADAGGRSGLAVLGGRLGLVGVAALLGAMEAVPEGGGPWAPVRWAVLAAPYLAATVAAFAPRAAVRGPVLLACALASLAFTVVLLRTGVPTLAATIVLFTAAFRDLRRLRWTARSGLRAAAVAAAGGLFLAAALAALYAGDGSSCWRTVRYPDGSLAVEVEQPAATAGEAAGGAVLSRGCSDVITGREGAASLASLAVGLSALLWVRSLKTAPGALPLAAPVSASRRA